MPFWPNVSIFDRSSEEWSQIMFDHRPMCSKPAPFVYSVSLTTSQLVAAPIYTMALYTLYAEKSANFRVYKRYLATHAVCNFTFELYLSSAMKPVIYLPYPILRFAGLHFINGFLIFFLFCVIILMTCWSIIELFTYRFKLISETNMCSDWVKKLAKVIKWWRWFLMMLVSLTVTTLAVCVVGIFDQNEHKIRFAITDLYPEIMCVSALVLPSPSDTGIKPIHLFNLSGVLGVIAGILLVLSLVTGSLLALQDMVRQTRASMRTVTMHKSFLFNLISQISVHLIMLGFPFVIYVVAVVFDFDGSAVGYTAIIVASLHGAMSTLAMMVFNRPLNHLATSKLSAIFIPNNVAVRNISFVSMHNTQ